MKPTNLMQIVAMLDQLDDESTVFAVKPWKVTSPALILVEPIDAIVSQWYGGQEFHYFLEVSVAKEIVEEISATAGTKTMNENICDRLIQYAINDA